jgi:magnesium transporter
VLSRLRTYVERLGLQKSQIDALDDIILENQQCARQAEIYSSVLSGLMDARGSIINNNVNVLLRNLTVINVIFLPLNLLAGIGGMSEFSMMTHAVDWRISYSLLLMFMVLVGLTTWIMIDRMISRRYTRGPKRPKQ